MTGQGRRFLVEPEAIAVLRQYGIPYPEHGVARDAEEAVQVAGQLGYPVVLKVVSPEIPHKSDVGGVAVGLDGAEAVRTGFRRMLDRVQSRMPAARLTGVLVCREAPPGLEAIVGAIDDPVFGPTTMFGLGGIFAEVLKDVSFRIAPLTRLDAAEMIREIRGYSLLKGARGQTACDVDALADLLLSVSRMVTERPEIKELDLNPVRLYEKGLLALDARVMVADG